MPDYVLRRLMIAVQPERTGAEGRRILVLGMAYKKNTGDARESPAIEVMRAPARHDGRRRRGDRSARRGSLRAASTSSGAGDGNRTRVLSLGSSCSASELHPRGARTVPTSVAAVTSFEVPKPGVLPAQWLHAPSTPASSAGIERCCPRRPSSPRASTCISATWRTDCGAASCPASTTRSSSASRTS